MTLAPTMCWDVTLENAFAQLLLAVSAGTASKISVSEGREVEDSEVGNTCLFLSGLNILNCMV